MPPCSCLGLRQGLPVWRFTLVRSPCRVADRRLLGGAWSVPLGCRLGAKPRSTPSLPRRG